MVSDIQTEKIANECVGGMSAHLRGRADLLNASPIDDHDPVGHLEGLVLIMCHEKTGELGLIMKLGKPCTELTADFGIKCPEGFV